MHARTLIATLVPTLILGNASAAGPEHHHACGVDCAQRAPAPLDNLRPLDRARPASAAFPRGGASLEDGSLIDMLVVYTPAAAAQNGGATGIEDQIYLGLDELNQATANSNINTTFRIVHIDEIAFTESGSMGAQLGSLRDPVDGILDEVHDLRDQYQADLVMLVINAGDVCGIANIGVGPGNTPTAENAFSVVASTCITGPVSAFAHEVGHNMGIIHGYEENPCTNGGSRFAKGYMAPDESFQTMMGVGPAPRTLRFSNPAVDFNGMPTGEPIGSAEPADSATAFALAAPVVAKYRDRDVNANGILDTDEIINGTLADCNANNVPDIAESDFNRNGIPDDCDITTGSSVDADSDGVPDEAEPAVLYVDADATGNEAGLDWASAIPDLQIALAQARASGDIEEIWIAEGLYLPASDGQRARRFDLVSGVALRGGFLGTETAPDQRPANPLHAAETILSGDLNQDDQPGLLNRDENTINTVFIFEEDERITLDRLVIEGGNANFEVNCGGFMFTGGGMLAFRADVDIVDCEFRDNTALLGGGLVISNFTPARVWNSWFHYNTAIDGVFYGAGGASPYDGYVGAVQLNNRFDGIDNQFVNNLVEFNADSESVGGVQILGGSPLFANNVITKNTSAGQFGASGLSIVLGVDVEIINCTIAFNNGPNLFSQYSSGISANRSQVILSNTILWGNTGNGQAGELNQFAERGAGSEHEINNSIVQGWSGFYNGTNSFDADPMFVDPGTNDFTPMPGSPAIDAGDNARLPLDDVDLDADADQSEALSLDFAFNERQINDPDTTDTGNGTAPIVDIGAFEFQIDTACAADFNTDGQLNFFDVAGFIGAFNAQDPAADITGDGLYNFFDVAGFIALFNAGCP